MSRVKGPLNTTCPDCKEMFHKPPSLTVIRCKDCRHGKQAVQAGPRKTGPVCPECSLHKALGARICRACYLIRLRGYITPVEATT